MPWTTSAPDDADELVHRDAVRRTTTVVHWGRQPVHVDVERGTGVARTRTRRLLLAVVVAAAVPLALFLARPGPAVVEVGSTAHALVRGPRPLVEGPQLAVLLSGTVTVLDGGCLGFATDSREAVLVLPPGTRALPDGDGVRVQGVDIHIGDRISGGMGPWETDQPDDWIHEQWPSAPSGCSEVDRATAIDDVELVDAG